jgi:selenocysteine-specific elongation factor
VREVLSRHHAENPLKEGLNRDELLQAFGRRVDPRLFESVLEGRMRAGEIRASGSVLSLSAHRITLSPAQERLRSAIRDLLAAARAAPPGLEEMAGTLSAKPAEVRAVVEAMQGLGEVVRVEADIVFDRGVFEELRGRLVACLQERGEITVADFRTVAETTRKYALPLMNLFDSQGVTLRRGDVRVLAK